MEDESFKDEKFTMLKEILVLFVDESIATTVNLLSGMSAAIASFQNEEMTKRQLETLKTDFLV